MVFRTAGAIAALLTGLGTPGGEALAQYYPRAQAYPPSQAYPPPQGYRPSVADADDNQLYDLQGRPLPPAAVGPQATEPAAPAPRYGNTSPVYPDEAALPPPPGAYREPPQQGSPPAPYGYERPAAAAQPAAPADQPRADRRWPSRTECDGNGARFAHRGGAAAGGAARDRPEEATAAAVPSHACRLPHQGTGRHDHHRHAEHLPLSRPRPGQGAALRGGRRPRGLHLVRRGKSVEDGGMARLDSAGGDDRAPALSAALHGRR